jgi:hypothetical protein
MTQCRDCKAKRLRNIHWRGAHDAGSNISVTTNFKAAIGAVLLLCVPGDDLVFAQQVFTPPVKQPAAVVAKPPPAVAVKPPAPVPVQPPAAAMVKPPPVAVQPPAAAAAVKPPAAALKQPMATAVVKPPPAAVAVQPAPIGVMKPPTAVVVKEPPVFVQPPGGAIAVKPPGVAPGAVAAPPAAGTVPPPTAIALQAPAATAISPAVAAAVLPAATLVHPDGVAAVSTSTPTRIRPDAVTIERGDTLDQFLARNHLAKDPVTVATVRRMNPSLNLDQLDTHAGQKVYVPKLSGASPSGGAVLQVHDPNFARIEISQARADIAALKQSVSANQKVFESPALPHRYQTVLADTTRAAQSLEAYTRSFTPTDTALLGAQFETLRLVADPAVTVGTSGSTGAPLTAARVSSLESNAEPFRALLKATSRSGVGYEDLRREVRVVVKSVDPSKPPQPRRVYVLPAAMVDRPGHYPDETLLSLLRVLTFPNLTTPASERFVFADLAVWVGPENAYAATLADVRNGRVNSQLVAIRDTSPRVIEVTFIER